VKIQKVTKFVKSSDANKKWFLVDAQDQVLGRLATKVARIIRGKNKEIFTPNADTGDFVVVINAEKVRFTGKRQKLKTYTHHSGYPGGLKTKSLQEVLVSRPEFVVQNAVQGMLPKNRLGKQLIKKLKVYSGTLHPHAAQKPEAVNL
jgi:large subunit ribosomal protein L13